MSTHAQVAVLEPGAMRRVDSRGEPEQLGRPGIRWAAFSVLALYGVLRWGTLLSPAPQGRLLVLVALAGVIAGPVRRLMLRARAPAAALCVLAVIGMFAISGVPLDWVEHARFAVTVRAISGGVTALPHVLVPYDGIDSSVRMVVTLGAGVLLLDAALMFCFAPRRITDAWAVGAALPLVVLAVLPSTLARPQVPYLHGLFLFALLALFVWADRVRPRDTPVAIGIAFLAAVAAMVAAPALDPHKPWLNYESLAGSLAPANLERFDWSQSYGPLNWPRDGREVLDVNAARADYWKAQDLDVFDGRRWVVGSLPTAAQLPPADPAAVQRWSQTIQVTLRSMQSTNVIAAGVAGPPQQVTQPVQAGSDAGTWIAQSPLQTGDSYRVRTYSPRPSAGQLAQASASYSYGLLTAYTSMLLPAPGTASGPAIVFPGFHSSAAPQRIFGLYETDASASIATSPYARTYALARRLAAGAPDPYAFVAGVMRYLAAGYRYDETPPVTRYPLETFLFDSKRGYCQQFAGAMALLLRMGGVPARVAAGFTPGSYNQSQHAWIVSDLNAHAWVEVWFPHFGWVRFDPTPLSAPARSSGTAAPPNLLRSRAAGGSHVSAPVHREVGGAAQPARAVHHASGSSPSWPTVVLALSILAALAAALTRTLRRRPVVSGDRRIAELERALERCGRPPDGGLTLARLEHRLGVTSPAGEYVRALRMARFGGVQASPTAAQRRALRVYLREGLGPLGRLRAWWALPPAALRRQPRPHRPEEA